MRSVLFLEPKRFRAFGAAARCQCASVPSLYHYNTEHALAGMHTLAGVWVSVRACKCVCVCACSQLRVPIVCVSCECVHTKGPGLVGAPDNHLGGGVYGLFSMRGWFGMGVWGGQTLSLLSPSERDGRRAAAERNS